MKALQTKLNSDLSSFLRAAALLQALLSLSMAAQAAGSHLQLRNGYFWDPHTQDYFVARGIAYQTFNPPVFAFQSFDQIEYDLREFKRMHANSVRLEFVWSQLEVEDDRYDWSKSDFIIAAAEKIGLKLFVLIGYQYPPSWFPDEWLGINDRGERSDVLNYEHPEAQRLYQDHIARVVARYKDSPVIGGWILGNEFAYFDLWEEPSLYPARRLLGFDPISKASFNSYLRKLYQNNLAQLNATWGTSHSAFEDIPMPAHFPAGRDDPSYHDLIQWRQQSIGNFVAGGAVRAKAADPNHLITYSMVGGIFNHLDANNTCEDGLAIVESCKAAGAPLDFWSVNNYSWASMGSDLRSGDYGVSKYRDLLETPVFVSETGHSSTDNLIVGAGPRQSEAVPGAIWESLMSGAIGIHLFHWSDRDQYAGTFLRERGFGIVAQNRLPKPLVYDNVRHTLRRMQEVRLEKLLPTSKDPPRDVQLFWSKAADIGWPRASQENAMIWGALKRLGYEPGLIEDHQFNAGAWRDAPALMLSRAFQMKPEDLRSVAQEVLAAGIHVHANSDLPGRFNTYHQANPDWPSQTRFLFGLDVSQAAPGWDGGATPDGGYLESMTLTSSGNFGPLTPDYVQSIVTWKIWHGIRAVAGNTVATHRGLHDSQSAMPALHLHQHGQAKTAVNTFGLGDTHASTPIAAWDFRYNILKAVYDTHFGITPTIRLSGSGAPYVTPDYRLCENGSVLISLLNMHTNTATVTLHAPSLIQGNVVEDLTTGELLSRQSHSNLPIELKGDDYRLLYVYERTPDRDLSLLNASPQKVWIQSAPMSVWPSPTGYELTAGYNVTEPGLKLRALFESTHAPFKIRGASPAAPVDGSGEITLTIPIADPDLNEPSYRSTVDGGAYQWRVVLEKNQLRKAETLLPVRVAWSMIPKSLPPVQAGGSYQIPIAWQELPSYLPGHTPTLLERAHLWDSLLATSQSYNLILELLLAGRVIASDAHVTHFGSGTAHLTISVPEGLSGPFTWRGLLEPAPNASHDLLDSFEDRDAGALLSFPKKPDFSVVETNTHLHLLQPWTLNLYAESEPGTNLYQNHGVHNFASQGAQSAFVVVTNKPTVGNFSGFFLAYRFPSPISIPSAPQERTGFSIGFDARIDRGLPAVLEVQLKDVDGGIIHFTQTYESGTNLWARIETSLDQLEVPTWSTGTFNPNRVSELILLVQMLEKEQQYVASFDAIRFNAPETFSRTHQTTTAYLSANDSLPDTDRDGIPDAYETGTGIFQGPQDTGTDPLRADSDGDGMIDGAELTARTSPLDPADFLRLNAAFSGDDRSFTLSWLAQPGLIYEVRQATDPSLNPPISFQSLCPILEQSTPTAGPLSATIQIQDYSSPLFFQLHARTPFE